MERRQALDGSLPSRVVRDRRPLEPCPATRPFDEFAGGSGKQQASTTMAFTRLLRNLARDKKFGPRVVPIVPDEARTFGMDSLFREFEIYAPYGQRYEPVDHALLLSYTEDQDGQILEEGITEAGGAGVAGPRRPRPTPTAACRWCRSSSSIRCSASSGWATSSGPPPTPGPGASCWAPPPGAPRCWARACSTRTATAWSWPRRVPACQAYDPAFAYELAAIIQDGIHRMYPDGTPPRARTSSTT